jgi:serine/threonine-protein kinase
MLVTQPLEMGQRVRLLDFGIALEGNHSALTRAEHIVGTPGYLAPEVLAGHSASPASDIYALGKVLQALATGRLPSSVDDARGEQSPPGRPSVPEALTRLIEFALQAEPDRRPANAAAFREQLLALKQAAPDPFSAVPGKEGVLEECPEIPTPEHLAGCRRCQEIARAVTEDVPRGVT